MRISEKTLLKYMAHASTSSDDGWSIYDTADLSVDGIFKYVQYNGHISIDSSTISSEDLITLNYHTKKFDVDWIFYTSIYTDDEENSTLNEYFFYAIPDFKNKTHTFFVVNEGEVNRQTNQKIDFLSVLEKQIRAFINKGMTMVEAIETSLEMVSL
ncbi:MAG: hypothetical protein KAS32_14300 [Candidatus Peribacteraceae bacterium]|nr:hypothetical protein [Candidatus Peribacteraceae bacterium]